MNKMWRLFTNKDLVQGWRNGTFCFACVWKNMFAGKIKPQLFIYFFLMWRGKNVK